jgi:hypothetical protein
MAGELGDVLASLWLTRSSTTRLARIDAKAPLDILFWGQPDGSADNRVGRRVFASSGYRAAVLKELYLRFGDEFWQA